MQNNRTILFAADLSENSVDAFRAACSLATGDQAHLVVLYVIEPEKAARAQAAVGIEDVHGTLARQLREVYVPKRPIAIEYRVIDGSPAEQIVGAADEVGASLIVMGTHGRTGLRRLVAGSVAIAVLRQAHCPVLVLRALKSRRLSGEIRVILHPTDFSKAAAPALDVASSLARDLGARLVILHVGPAEVYQEGKVVDEKETKGYQASLDQIRQRVDGVDLKHPIETRLVRGLEAEEIVRVAKEIGSDLIVMGTHGRKGISGILMGNTAESVLPEAHCPVMVVKGPKRVAPAPSADPLHRQSVTIL